MRGNLSSRAGQPLEKRGNLSSPAGYVPNLSIATLTASRASMMLVAWLVEPEASGVVNSLVDFPNGRLSMKGEMSTQFTHRPSSARTYIKKKIKVKIKINRQTNTQTTKQGILR